VVANTPELVLFSNLAFCANDDVVANEAVLGVNVIEFAALAVVAKDEDRTVHPVACAELLTIPFGSNNDPLIVPRTLNDPVN
jgi:hypothetical protein